MVVVLEVVVDLLVVRAFFSGDASALSRMEYPIKTTRPKMTALARHP